MRSCYYKFWLYRFSKTPTFHVSSLPFHMAMHPPDAGDEEGVVAATPEQPKPAMIRSRTASSDELSISSTIVADPELPYDVEDIAPESDP